MQTIYRNLEPETVNYFSLSGATGDQFLLNENIKLIKYGAGVSLSSIACDLSTVNGTAFITNPVFTTTGIPSNDLRWAVGFKHSLVAAAKTLVGWGKAAGTGETLGTEKHIAANAASDPNANEANATTGWTATNTSTFESVADPAVGNYSLHSVRIGETTAWAQTTGDTSIVGALYYLSASAKKINDGSLFTQNASGNSIKEIIITTSWAAYTKYVNNNAGTGAGAGFYMRMGSANDEVFLDNYSRKQVTAPSATGIIIQTSKTDVTQNFTSDNGIDPNATSFVDTITAS